MARPPTFTTHWEPAQYLLFERERTLPCLDLLRRIGLESPARIVDLGSGPGTSTAALKARWPRASITGVDNSPPMLDAARRSDSTIGWIPADIGAWEPGTEFDLVFSNAALQWLPDHPTLVPRWWRRVAAGGAFAFQVPAPGSERSRWLEAIRTVLDRPEWRQLASATVQTENVLSLEQYYGLLAGGSHRLELWDTEYCHVLPNVQAIVEWTKGTALRLVLDRLGSEPERARFTALYAAEIAQRYRPQADGRVLFPFLRRFVIAYRD